MNKIIDRVTGLTAYIFYTGLFVIYIIGIFHCFKKHSTIQGVVSVVAFPFGIYRGFESLFHDDFKDVNWKVRLKNDTKTCIYFLNEINNENFNQYNFNKDLEEFSNKIKKYPLDKREILIKNVKQYIGFIILIEKDINNYLDSYKGGRFNLKFSNRTQKQLLKIEHNIYFNKYEVSNLKKGNENFNESIKSQEINNNDLNLIKLSFSNNNKNMLEVFYNIFNERYD
jgi:hypothetical protein